MSIMEFEPTMIMALIFSWVLIFVAFIWTYDRANASDKKIEELKKWQKVIEKERQDLQKIRKSQR